MASSSVSLEFLDPPKQSGDLGTLGQYRVIDQLGKGGMGYVFRAIDTRLKRTVALKVMNKKVAAVPGSRKRFISEARAMAAVHHDNVATIFEVNEYKGTVFMAMEMLHGETLEKFKKIDERPGYEEIIRQATEIARGLAAAHEKGIVHRDIKPANIWIEEGSDRIKILDFGLALAHTPVDQLSGRGAVIGTPGYLSPEQARSEPVDDRSDLYSVGVVLYELATAKLPLQAKTISEQLIAILAHPATPVRDHNPDIPQPLADLIHKLMEKEPRNRIASAKDLEEELKRVSKECESKSEVAQAINKLQMGLSEVVNKKSQPDFNLDPVSEPQPNPLASMPDPFAALPETIPAASVAGAPVAGAAPSGNGIVSPAGRSGIHPAVAPGSRPLNPKAKSNGENGISIKKIWPILAIAAVLLILIPIVAFSLSTGSPHANESVIVGVDDNDSPSVAPANNTNQSRPPRTNPSANQSPTQPSVPDPDLGPQLATGNDGKSYVAAVPVSLPSINSAMAPGATDLIAPQKKNGSFENGTPEQRTNQKFVINAWVLKRQGSDAGWKGNDPRAASHGSRYAYVGKDTDLELNGENVGGDFKEGDIIRLTYDIGGVGIGKSHYTTILGFRSSPETGTRYRVFDEDDGTSLDATGMRTVGHQYVVKEADLDHKVFVRFLISNKGRQREFAFIDNVRMTVAPSGSANVAQNTVPTPANARNSNAPPPNSLTSSNPPSNAMANPPPSETMQQTAVNTNNTGTPPDPAPTEPKPPATVRSVTLKTSDEFGADTAVKKGGSNKETHGTDRRLAAQTRNGKQLQHVYLRFVTAHLRGNVQNNQNKQNNKDKKPLKIGEATLVLNFDMPKRPNGATIRVYGFDDPRSDIWPENKLVWTNSLSKDGLDSLPIVAQKQVDVGGATQFVIDGNALQEFIANSQNRTITFVIAAAYGNAPVFFASREHGELDAPTLSIGLLE